MDKLKVTGIEFYAYHGVLESEKQLGQTFSVDVEFELDVSMCGDDLKMTVNYGEVSLDVVDFCKSNRFDLLESLANNLSKHLLRKYTLMNKIKVTIHKPHAPITTKFSDVTLTVERGWSTCYLAIGSNLGDREAYLNGAIEAINTDENMMLLAKSSYIETAPYGVSDQPDFLNGAVKIKTIYTPRELLNFCKNAENSAGRVKKRVWGERTLDVDILMYSDLVYFSDDLKIPHAEMHFRDFVLEPLCEIEPYLIHPIYKQSIRELLRNH